MTIIIYNYNELLEKDGEYQSEFLQVFHINLVILSKDLLCDQQNELRSKNHRTL